ncbi:MAG: hypothetical protein K9M11_00420 [Candidatus Pacebacteria bacterium]|nr:hypothetical protein [Candidatus Paceibacterota bacterium]
MFKRYINYYKDNPQGYWFKRKVFGWGWVPVTWQGWTVIAVWLLGVLAFAFTLDKNSPPREVAFTFILPILFLTIALIRICYKKGEEPGWRWGLPKNDVESKDDAIRRGDENRTDGSSK